MDEQWGYVGAKSRRSAGCFTRMYIGYGGTVVAHVFSERTLATLERLPRACCRPLKVVVWMTDGWPLYESRLKGTARYQQAIYAAH